MSAFQATSGPQSARFALRAAVAALAASLSIGAGGSHLRGTAPLPSRNLGIEIESFVASQDHIVFRAREFIQGGDLTGDGDAFDWPAFHYDVASQRVELLASNVLQRAGDLPVVIEGDWAAFQAGERGQDLNGDGDSVDFVVQLCNLRRGTRLNLGLATDRFNFQQFVLRDGVLAFQVSERVPGSTGSSGQGVDLNGDGDRFDDILFLHELASGVTTNLGLGANTMWIEDGLLLTSVSEGVRNLDLNGDGDRRDVVLHVVNLADGSSVNLGVAGTPLAVRRGRALVTVAEAQEQSDLNGDGDQLDSVLHDCSLASGLLRNLGLWASLSRGAASAGYEEPHGDGRFVALYAAEAGQSADLNGDGDIGGGDFVLHVYDFETGALTNTGYAVIQGGSTPSFPEVHGERLSFWVAEEYQSADLNGDGDAFDAVLHLRDLRTGVTRNLGLANSTGGLAYSYSNDRHLAFLVDEQNQGNTDLDGNGDANDRVLYWLDTKLDQLTLVGPDLFVHALGPDSLVFQEPEVRVDRNGDGDLEDDVVRLLRLDTGRIHELGLATFRPGTALASTHLIVSVWERDQGATDFNGNGTTFESVAHVVPLFGRAPFR